MRRIGPKDVLGTLLALLYGLPAWAYPFGNDQGLHWYLGWRWLHGELPFVSGVSSKPVGIFAIHALTTAIFGNGMWPIRVTEGLTVCAIGWLIAAFARPSGREPADGERGVAALLFAGCYYTFFDYWDTAHPELFEGAIAFSALYVALRAKTPWKRDAGAGALTMAAFMIKFPAALPCLAVSGVCAARAVEARKAGDSAIVAILQAAGRFLAGALPVLVLCVLPFAVTGKLGPMWEILYDFIIRYADGARHRPSASVWPRPQHAGALLAMVLAAASATWAIARERRDEETESRIGWLFVTLILAAGSVVVQGRYFDYHYVVIMPFCVAVLVMAIVHFRREPRRPSWGTLAATAGVVALLFAAGPRWIKPDTFSYKQHTKVLLQYLDGEISRQQYLQHFVGRGALDAYARVERVSEKVLKKARPGDTLCSRGFATPIYQLTGMRCPSRHIVQDVVPNGLPSWTAEYRTTLERTPPSFVVTFTDRKKDLEYLKSRGYGQLGSDGKFAIYARADVLTRK
jgi:hypothetical protein